VLIGVLVAVTGLGFDRILDFGVLRCGMNYGRVATGESLVPNDASRSRGGRVSNLMLLVSLV
jgi:hypothetical protein